MKMSTKLYTIKRLFQGIASVRDYVIADCLRKGKKLKIVYDHESMILQPEQLLDKRFQINKRTFRSKYYPYNNYTLYDYRWNPINPTIRYKPVPIAKNGCEATASVDSRRNERTPLASDLQLDLFVL